MDLIRPDGTKEELKAEEPKKEEAASQKPEGPPKPPFVCNIGNDGIMRIEVNLGVCVGSEDMFCMLRGFLDSKRDEALSSIIKARVELAKQKATIIQAKNKGLFNGFLHKLGRR